MQRGSGPMHDVKELTQLRSLSIATILLTYANGIGANAINQQSYLNQRMYVGDTDFSGEPKNVGGDPLIESLPDHAFAASSYWVDGLCLPYYARRDSQRAWCASTANNTGDYLQVDLGDHIAITDQYVTTYTLSYSIDGPQNAVDEARYLRFTPLTVVGWTAYAAVYSSTHAKWSDQSCQFDGYSLCNHPYHTVIIKDSICNLIGIVDILDEVYVEFDIEIQIAKHEDICKQPQSTQKSMTGYEDVPPTNPSPEPPTDHGPSAPTPQHKSSPTCSTATSSNNPISVTSTVIHMKKTRQYSACHMLMLLFTFVFIVILQFVRRRLSTQCLSIIFIGLNFTGCNPFVCNAQTTNNLSYTQPTAYFEAKIYTIHSLHDFQPECNDITVGLPTPVNCLSCHGTGGIYDMAAFGGWGGQGVAFTYAYVDASNNIIYESPLSDLAW
eukprot:931962_1